MDTGRWKSSRMSEVITHVYHSAPICSHISLVPQASPLQHCKMLKPFHTLVFSICHLTCDSFLNAPLGFAQSHERALDLRHYKTPKWLTWEEWNTEMLLMEKIFSVMWTFWNLKCWLVILIFMWTVSRVWGDCGI
jgi:hypothetical protein